MWARLAEAGIPVAFHLGDSGYTRYAAAWGGPAEFEPFTTRDPLNSILVDDRAIYDTMASMITHGVFQRHPSLRVASIENGSDWVAVLAKRLRKKANQAPKWFPEDPLDVLRRNVWVTPYYEEDIPALAETIGVDKVLFGSDWPHGEGLAGPFSSRGGAHRLRRARRSQNHARQRHRLPRRHARVRPRPGRPVTAPMSVAPGP